MYTYFNQETTGTKQALVENNFLQTIPVKKYLENLVKKSNNRYWSVIIVESCYQIFALIRDVLRLVQNRWQTGAPTALQSVCGPRLHNCTRAHVHTLCRARVTASLHITPHHALLTFPLIHATDGHIIDASYSSRKSVSQQLAFQAKFDAL